MSLQLPVRVLRLRSRFARHRIMPVVATIVGSAASLSAQAVQDTARACAPSKLPKNLPAVDRIIDSVTTDSGVTALGLSSRPFQVLLTFQFGVEGRLEHAALLERDVGVDTAIAIGALVGVQVRPQEAVQGGYSNPWAVRLRVRVADANTFSIERSTYCPPELQSDPAGDRSVVEFALPVPPSAQPLSIRRYRLRVLVTATGRAARTVLLASSGIRAIDDLALARAERAYYVPALLDGHPVTAWHEVTPTAR